MRFIKLALTTAAALICVTSSAQILLPPPSPGDGERSFSTPQTLLAEIPTTTLIGFGDGYGSGVAHDGEWMAVSAAGDVSNAGEVYLFRANGSGGWEYHSVIHAPLTAASGYFGSSLDLSGTWLIAGAFFETVNGHEGAGAAYLYHYDGSAWVSKGRLQSATPGQYNNFGASVAIAGVTSTVIAAIGEPGNDDAAANAGEVNVYLYDWVGGDWDVEATLNGTAVSDFFGKSLGLNTNLLLLVGAPFSDIAVTNGGAVFAYWRLGSAWNPAGVLTAVDAANGRRFGDAVAVNSAAQVVVGSPYDQTAGTNKGSAYFFEYAGSGTWTQVDKFLPDSGSLFGWQVAIDGARAIVGHNHDDTVHAHMFNSVSGHWSGGEVDPLPDVSSNVSSFHLYGTQMLLGLESLVDVSHPGGAAYLVFESMGTWALDTELLPLVAGSPDVAAGDHFGTAVDITRNYLISGAPDASHHFLRSVQSGAAYIYGLVGNQWVSQELLLPPDGEAGDKFGSEVAIEWNFAAVGAPEAGVGGKVYIFERSGVTWSHTQTLVAEAPGDRFGAAVDIDSGLIVVGAPGHDASGQVDGGKAYAYYYDWNTQTYVSDGAMAAQTPETGAEFGTAVAIDGTALIVGAAHEGGKGRAYVFRRSADPNTFPASWAQEDRFRGDDTATGDRFGSAVAISGNRALVGAYKHDNNLGSAYVFTFDGNDWAQTQELTRSDAQTGDHFGYAVALDEIYALVGAEQWDGNGTDAGCVYYYEYQDGEFSEAAAWQSSAPGASEFYGHSVALHRAMMVIGEADDNLAGADAGSAEAVTYYNVFVSEFSGPLEISESGDTVSFELRLGGPPSNGVSVQFVTNDECYIDWNYLDSRFFNSVTFTEYDWDYARLVSVYAINDDEAEGAHLCTIETSVISDDQQYDGMVLPDWEVVVHDNEILNLVTDSGFEFDNGSWEVSYTGEANDKVKCDKPDKGKFFAAVGRCAFRFKGVMGENSKIKQTVEGAAHAFEPGDYITGLIRADGSVEADATFTIKVKYDDKIAHPTQKLTADITGEGVLIGYDQIAATGSASETSIVLTGTAAQLNKIKILVKNKSLAGKLYIDDVQVGWAAEPIGVLPPPSEPDGFRGSN